MKTYKHLNQEERDLTAVHLAEGKGVFELLLSEIEFTEEPLKVN